ncbi:MAG TPA: hypothetical protein VJR23_13755 [Candidatus Acidoferrales bacterium]|nr:hypothetical protein [Candidatus Acidoferrales bacterium]
MISKFSLLRSAIISIVSLLAFGAASLATSAQNYKAETTATPAPGEVAAPIRAQLAPNPIKVSGPSGALCEIWLRSPMPATGTAGSGGAILFGQINQGALVGVVRFDSKGADFREQTVQPGVYTMRYMLQPVDGNHQGVSQYRDFLLLVPASLDTTLDDMAPDALIKASKKASGTGHPSVWSLMPSDGAPSTLPGIAHQDDADLWVVFFQDPLAKPLTMGLVVVGHAPET